MKKEEMEKKQDILKKVSKREMLKLAKISSARMLKKNRQAYKALTYK